MARRRRWHCRNPERNLWLSRFARRLLCAPLPSRSGARGLGDGDAALVIDRRRGVGPWPTPNAPPHARRATRRAVASGRPCDENQGFFLFRRSPAGTHSRGRAMSPASDARSVSASGGSGDAVATWLPTVRRRSGRCRLRPRDLCRVPPVRQDAHDGAGDGPARREPAARWPCCLSDPPVHASWARPARAGGERRRSDRPASA